MEHITQIFLTIGVLNTEEKHILKVTVSPNGEPIIEAFNNKGEVLTIRWENVEQFPKGLFERQDLNTSSAVDLSAPF